VAKHSNIEWTHHTWNPWVGCTKVSAACDNCYAEGWAKRAGRDVWGPHNDRQRTKTWGDPLKWNKALEGTGRRERVFVASLADVFDNHKSILPDWRAEMWALIKSCPNLDFLLLTKRPQNIKRFLPDDWGYGWANVWLGTTVEDQEEAERRIPHLLRVNAPIHFLSCEPLCGPIDLNSVAGVSGDEDGDYPVWWDALTGIAFDEGGEEMGMGDWIDPGIDWVIVGGESGHGARPMHPSWARSLRDQCAAAGVPFFFKQWGEWLPGEFGTPPDITFQNGEYLDANLLPDFDQPETKLKWDDGFSFDSTMSHAVFKKVGKKKAGRLLDGNLHDAVCRGDAE
jgi:protein gp37